MTSIYKKDRWLRRDREAIILRYDDGLLVARYRGFYDYKSYSWRLYPDKVLCKGWRFDGVKVVDQRMVQ